MAPDIVKRNVHFDPTDIVPKRGRSQQFRSEIGCACGGRPVWNGRVSKLTRADSAPPRGGGGNTSVGQHTNPWAVAVSEEIPKVKRERRTRDRIVSQVNWGHRWSFNVIPTAPRNTSSVTLVVKWEGGLRRRDMVRQKDRSGNLRETVSDRSDHPLLTTSEDLWFRGPTRSVPGNLVPGWARSKLGA